MASGAYNVALTYELPAVTRNDSYEAVESFSAIATVWADIDPVSGREYFAGAAVQNDATFKIKIRHRRDITTRGRFRNGNRIYEITAVINVKERNRELICLCREQI